MKWQIWFTCSFSSLTNPTYIAYTNSKEHQSPALLETEGQLSALILLTEGQDIFTYVYGYLSTGRRVSF